MKPEALQFERVNIVYPNGFCAAREASFTVKAGECLAIVGESGSGKTTLARAALGLLPPDTKITGSIKVDGAEIINSPKKNLRRVRGLVAGLVTQNPFAACHPLATVFDHVAEAWRVHNKKNEKTSIFQALENLGINNAEQTAQKFPHQWSGGMLQRATIAAATAHAPTIVIADEPTSALDTSRAELILTALCRSGAAVLLISHDIALVARHADRIAVCQNGEIVEINTAQEILKNPRHALTISLLEAKVVNEQSKFLEANASIVLQAENLSRNYQTICTVSNANLEIRAGEIVGIYGDSGSGKSTLLRMLATIETPSAGSLRWNGEPAMSFQDKWISQKKNLGCFVMPIFQDPVGSLDRRWAIWRSVTEPLTAKHFKKVISAIERRQIASKILAEVGLSRINLDAKPNQLSVGQCQRVCIARALIAAPTIILADEPTSALDPFNAREIMRLFAAAADRGIAVVIVSHNETQLRAWCHRVMRMHNGVLEK